MEVKYYFVSTIRNVEDGGVLVTSGDYTAENGTISAKVAEIVSVSISPYYDGYEFDSIRVETSYGK